MSQDNFSVVRIRKADKDILEAMANAQGRSVINMLSVVIARADQETARRNKKQRMQDLCDNSCGSKPEEAHCHSGPSKSNGGTMNGN